MDSLVLLILGAVWAAVLIPPLLRSRIDNRPSSSVTDFRRQLNKLQATVPSRTGNHRAMARPLAQSPLARPAAAGRPGQPAARRMLGRQHGTGRDATTTIARQRDTRREARSNGGRRHGDHSGAQPRPARRERDTRTTRGAVPRRDRQPDRRTRVSMNGPTNELTRRRRSNVLVAILILAGGSLFLAATTKETIMLYVFALTFLALCGYVYLLGQARQRENQAFEHDWMS